MLTKGRKSFHLLKKLYTNEHDNMAQNVPQRINSSYNLGGGGAYPRSPLTKLREASHTAPPPLSFQTIVCHPCENVWMKP